MTCIQTTLDLVPPEPRGWTTNGHQGYSFALQDGPLTAGFALPGSAASASARAMHWGKGLAKIVHARWVMAWNPCGLAISGAQLTHVVEGFDDPEPTIIGTLSASVAETPIVGSIDVTEALNKARVQAADTVGFFVHKLRGKPIIFASSLELVWEIVAPYTNCDIR